MAAYLLIVLAILTRVVPHPGWMNFTVVGGALLFFGARRPWKEMIFPVLALMATDYYLTVYQYHYSFQGQAYISTWVWYAMAMALGQILLRARTTWLRWTAGVVLGPTSFFVVSNYAVWLGSGMYPHNMGGFYACFVAALPFYRNDFVSTALVAGLAFGVPVLLRRSVFAQPATVPVRK
jgi:hypothetical protein